MSRSINEYLARSHDARFAEGGITSFEIIEVNSASDGVLRREHISSDGLTGWLQSAGHDTHTVGDDSKPCGTLKLLLSLGEEKPFADAEQMDMVIRSMGLSPSYSYVLGTRRTFPILISEGAEEMLRITCQTPRFEDCFMSLSLCHDPKTGLTTAFLSVARLHLEALVKKLTDLMCYVDHPLFLPVALLSNLVAVLRNEMREFVDDIEDVQMNTELLREYLGGPTDDDITRQKSKENPQEIHKKLVETHAGLTRGLSNFVCEMTRGCRLGMDRSCELAGRLNSPFDIGKTGDINGYLDILELESKSEFDTRERLLGRIGVQLQIVYNEMQQYIADRARDDNELARQDNLLMKRDSSQMKSIALLTMIFLPTTALASIFSMSPFFDRDPISNSVSVSPDFWVFWVVSVPLTLSVVSLYVSWIQRKEMYRWWRARGWQHVRKQPDRLGDGLPKFNPASLSRAKQA